MILVISSLSFLLIVYATTKLYTRQQRLCPDYFLPSAIGALHFPSAPRLHHPVRLDQETPWLASSKDTPCLSLLLFAFRGFQSNTYYVYTIWANSQERLGITAKDSRL